MKAPLYVDWLHEVDELLLARYGVTHLAFPQYNLRDWYRMGVRPDVTVDEVWKRSQEGGED